MKPAESFIGQPIRSLQTMLRVIAEDNHRLPTIVPDGIYGQETIYAVSAFQQYYGLPITGITNQATWDEIVKVYESALIRIEQAEPIQIIMDPGQVFVLGENNPYIFLLQSLLTQLSVDSPSIIRPEHTGILDDKTAQALSEFQNLSGLPITGELDKITWKHLVKQFSLNSHHNMTVKDN